ncbi:hypothetical protein ABZ835_19560 [Streptomyces sp. NPDC047461]|uniref:hypothetical protein n=1 Tax=Streptomyces sp. NPDC047461 TaxID=3155619 RepID=UPI0033C6FBA1
MRDIDGALRALDPAGPAGETEAADRTRARLDMIVGTPRPARSIRSRGSWSKRWVCAGVSVAASAAIVLVVADPFGTTGQPAATWSVEHFVRESWSLSTRIDGLQVTSAVVPEYRETWEKPDGSSRWTVKTLPPQFQSAEQRKTWEAAGAVGQTPEESSDSAPARTPVSEPPATPECMQNWLGTGHTSLTPGLAFEVVPERFMDHVFSPAQRAALLRVLQRMDGIVYAGVVRDRAGREGQAFSLAGDFGGLPNKRTLVFAPSTGSLLAYEEELTGDPGALNVKTPAVIDYSTLLTAERTP